MFSLGVPNDKYDQLQELPLAASTACHRIVRAGRFVYALAKTFQEVFLTLPKET